MPQVNWMIAGDFNRDPSTITSTVDRELANRIRVVFQLAQLKQAEGLLIMQLQEIQIDNKPILHRF